LGNPLTTCGRVTLLKKILNTFSIYIKKTYIYDLIEVIFFFLIPKKKKGKNHLDIYKNKIGNKCSCEKKRENFSSPPLRKTSSKPIEEILTVLSSF